MTVENVEYYPNVSNLVDENGKPYRYEYDGNGFKNKRTLHEAMVRDFLSTDANVRLDDDKQIAFKKLREIYPDDSFQQTNSKLNVGFFNRTKSAVHYNLEQLAKEVEQGDDIQVITFNMPYGNVMAFTSFPLNPKVLNDKGNKVMNAVISSDPLAEEKSSLEEDFAKSESQILSGRISADPLA